MEDISEHHNNLQKQIQREEHKHHTAADPLKLIIATSQNLY